ncbi:MAG: hypothetical protein HY608_01400, partial [Planctomycetes bacterium]|nr:hypothetical protein [Planctomycetota bacterium]
METGPGNGGRSLRAIRRPTVVARLVVWIALVLSMIQLPLFTAADHLDESWHQALHYAVVQGWQAGRDYVFSLGPLGFLYARAYEPRLFGIRVGWAVLIASVAATVFLLSASQLVGRYRRGLFLVTLWIFCSIPDVVLMLVLLFGTRLLLRPERPKPGWLGLWILLCSVLALIKFSLFVQACLCVGALAASLVRRGRWRQGILCLASAAMSVMALWIGIGQAILNFPGYLRGSFSLAAGYDGAMALAGASREVHLALVAMAACVAGLLVGVDRPKHASRREDRLLDALGVSFLFLAWKHGFVRQDGHVLVFFSFSLP